MTATPETVICYQPAVLKIEPVTVDSVFAWLARAGLGQASVTLVLK